MFFKRFYRRHYNIANAPPRALLLFFFDIIFNRRAIEGFDKNYPLVLYHVVAIRRARYGTKLDIGGSGK